MPAQAKSWLSLYEVRRAEPLARELGVSTVARSKTGFVTAYKKYESPIRMPARWHRTRAAFIARHYAQGREEGWWRGGLPTRRHLALVMWAYSPTPTKLSKFLDAIGGLM